MSYNTSIVARRRKRRSVFEGLIHKTMVHAMILGLTGFKLRFENPLYDSSKLH